MTIKDKLRLEDFVICVRPQLTSKQEWTGEVDVSVVSSADNPLNDEDYYGLLEFCRVMCATVPLMEYDDNLRNKALNILKKEDEVYENNKAKKKAKIVDKHDNVVVVSFNADTNTKGNA
jgi:hypothetical protein